MIHNKKVVKAQAGTKTSMADHGSDFMTNIMNAVSTMGMSTVGDAISGFSPKAAAAVEKYSLGMIPYTHKETQIANRSSTPNYKANRVSSLAGAMNGAAAGVLTGGVLKAVIPSIVNGALTKSAKTPSFSNLISEGEYAAASPVEQINMVRLKTRAPKQPRPQSFLKDLDIGHGMIERTRNPLSTKNEGLLKEVHLVGDKTKRIQLMQRKMDDGRDAYFFTAGMSDSPLQAGRAFKQLETHIPKGSLIVEGKSLSNDSFYNMLKRASKTKLFKFSDEGYVPLNNQAKHNLFTNQEYAMKDTQNIQFQDFNQARIALAEVNAKITQPGIPKAKLSKIVTDVRSAPAEGAPIMDYMTSPKGPTYKKTTFGIDIPNIGLTKLYLKGGILYKPAAITSASPHVAGSSPLESHNNLQRVLKHILT
jgi:hypothetical protein